MKPNWFCLNSGFSMPARLLKKLFASKLSLRKNSKRSPWNELVPDFVIAFTTFPMLQPYWAVKAFVCTLNSWISSTPGT